MLSLLGKLNIHIPEGGATLETVIFCLLLSFILSMIIAFVYRTLNKGFSYEGSFNLTLIMVCLIVASIMITIGSNIALSLGLIGSLSIIRFRTVLKNTLDMAYLFWTIAVGLAVGAQNYYMAIGVVLFISTIMFILNKTNFHMKANSGYIIVVQMDNDSNHPNNSGIITDILNNHGLKWNIRSSYVDNNTNTKEITYSIYSKKFDNYEGILDKAREITSVRKISLLSPETNLFI